MSESMRSLPSISVRDSTKRFCWIGGDTPNFRPKNWNGPWMLHVAHIASGRARAIRADDRRAVVLLSPICHDLHVSNTDRLPFKWVCGEKLPTIDERHTLWAKQQFDPGYYDRDYLQSIWIGKLPEPERPPEYWRARMMRNQGIV